MRNLTLILLMVISSSLVFAEEPGFVPSDKSQWTRSQVLAISDKAFEDDAMLWRGTERPRKAEETCVNMRLYDPNVQDQKDLNMSISPEEQQRLHGKKLWIIDYAPLEERGIGGPARIIIDYETGHVVGGGNLL